MGDKPQEVGLAGFAGMKPEPIGASQTEYQSTQANYETSQGRYEYSHVKYEQTQIFYQPHSSAQSEQKPLQSSDPSAEKGYTVTGSGTNDQGNHYCNRDYNPSYGGNQANKNPYHYSNKDGSFYYSNPDGSKYYNNGQGGASYESPRGRRKEYGNYGQNHR